MALWRHQRTGRFAGTSKETLMTPIKARIGIALLALVGSVAATGAASAGTWHLNAAACPDLLALYGEPL